MRRVYVWRDGKIVPRGESRPKPRLQVVSDIPEYISPMSMKPVDGRRARREEMKRFNVREVDPSERPPGAGISKTEAQAAAERAELAARPNYTMPEHVKRRLMRGH